MRGLVMIEHNIEGLPDGLVLDVTVQDDGFRATRGEALKLVP